MSGNVPGTAVPWNGVYEVSAASAAEAATLLTRDVSGIPGAEAKYIRGANTVYTPLDFCPQGVIPGRRISPDTTDDAIYLQKMHNSGERCEYYPGEFNIREKQAEFGIIDVISRPHLEIIFHADTTIKVRPEVGLNPGSLFRLSGTSDFVADITKPSMLIMRGGTIDLSPLRGTAILTSAFDIYSFRKWLISGMRVTCGTSAPNIDNPGYGKGDTGYTWHNCGPGTLENTDVEGFEDSGGYASGSGAAGVSDGIGEFMNVVNCNFNKCSNGIAFKRNFYALKVVNLSFKDCKVGILASPADTPRRNNHGKVLQAVNCSFDAVEGFGIRLVGGRGSLIDTCRFKDWGVRRFDRKVVGGAQGNFPAAISLSGVKDSTVRGCTMIGHDELQLVEPAPETRLPHGIHLETNTWDPADIQHSTRNRIDSNRFFNIERAILEDTADNDSNIYSWNEEYDTLYPSIYRGPNSRVYNLQEIKQLPQLATDVRLRGEAGDPADQTLGEVHSLIDGRSCTFSCRIELGPLANPNGTAAGISGPVYIDLPDYMPLAVRETPVLINSGGLQNSLPPPETPELDYTTIQAVIARDSRRIAIFESGKAPRRRVHGSQFLPGASLSIGGTYTSKFVE